NFVTSSSSSPFFTCGESLDARKRHEKTSFSAFFSRLYHDLPAVNRWTLGKSTKKQVFLHFSLAYITI
ncbi:MAG: hypothetical protein IKP43_12800, partial [Bacteroidaceae bacterium]|nr:hypothetical protein [Bacteroidaceae bacterium]